MSTCKKSFLSRCVLVAREGLKRACTRAGGALLRTQCYSLLGVPCGLVSGAEHAQTLYPTETFVPTPPLALDGKVHEQFAKRLAGLPLPPAGVLKLDNGLATSLGGALLRGKLVTCYLQPIDNKLPQDHALFRFSTSRFLPTLCTVQGPVVSITSGWQGAFYHWMHEVLPRLHLIEKAQVPLKSLHIASHTPFQKESLALLGLQGHVVDAHTYAGVRTHTLFVPSTPEVPTAWSCQFLRDRFLPFLDVEGKPPLRLYVSRSDATRRRVANEEALLPILEKWGFTCVNLSTRTLQEQMTLFARASMVVGPHGAGFSHLVFCKPKTPVLELFAPEYVHPCYWHISDRCALLYHTLFGESSGCCADMHQDPADPDMHIDPTRFDKALNSIFSTL